MAHIFWELHKIPIPEEAYINHNDGRVFLMRDDGNGGSKRRVIGHATSDTMMHPNELYHLRDASEKQFMIRKSQLGFDVTRVHTTDSLIGKFAVCFAAAILRSKIMTACHTLQLDTNRMIRKIDRIALVLMTDGTYSPINNLAERQKQLLNCFGISAEMLGSFADDVNRRKMSPINSRMHLMPVASGTEKKKKRGRPSKAHNETNNEPKRKPGRPKGSKNKPKQ